MVDKKIKNKYIFTVRHLCIPPLNKFSLHLKRLRINSIPLRENYEMLKMTLY